MDIMQWFLVGFSVLALLIFIIVVVMFVQDITQKQHAVLRNYPVIGRLRYFLERQGEYFRQYFFSDDRQELPFNRATRSWVYRTSKNLGGTIGFGSTNDLREPGSIIFVNSPFPLLEEECVPSPSLVIGPNCRKPFYAKKIVNISGMSYGAISAPAVQALSKGAAKEGFWLNTGEGGITSYHLSGGCDLVVQIGTAKFGVRDLAGNLSTEKLKKVSSHKAVKAFEIKLSQGAKPGRGGVLPAVKVDDEVAEIRGIPIGVTCSSPNRHPEIKTPDDILDLVHEIREATGCPVGIKTVIGDRSYPEKLCEAILERGVSSAPDFITLDGGEGGTGAAPQVLADHVGLPLSESLPILADILIEKGLKERIRIIASGKIVTSANVAWAMSLGADFVVTARGFMFSLGCIQSLQCHQDTCPTGITTHNKRLQKGLVIETKVDRVANYGRWMNVEADRIAHSCGLQHARKFKRDHVRIVQTAGKSLRLDELYPYPVKVTTS